MKRSFITLTVVALLVFVSGCKTSDSEVDNFRILALTGYSFADSGEAGMTTVNLFFSVTNNGDTTGTIISWRFRIMHNIVTLVEIDNNNFASFNLRFSGNTTLPPDEVSEIYVNTPLPYGSNAIPDHRLSFGTYTPTEVILDLTVQDEEGRSYTVTKKGAYTYEKGVIDGEQYNILGNWELSRVVNGDAKAAQKITFVGTKAVGSFVIYNMGSGKSEGSGSFTVANYKYITLQSTDGTSYWGEFTGINDMKGTLLKGTDTGFWFGKKLW